MFKLTKVFTSTLLVGLFGLAIVSASHIDDNDMDLENFSYDRVVFRTVKDCSLDKIPDIRYFLEVDGGKYPKLDIYLAEGEPRFELSMEGKVVDTIRVSRYDMKAIRKLLADLGVQRDENYSYEKKAAQIELEQAFNVPHPPPAKPAAAKEEL